MTASPTQFYTWKGYRCTYEVHQPINAQADGIPLLLIHPIGVGLSRHFWRRFCQEWYGVGRHNQIYNPDLIGCGDGDMPRVACTPDDWAEQLHYFLQTVVKKPVVVVVQGALFPVAVELVSKAGNLVKGLVCSSPPAWVLVTTKTPEWQHKVAWNLFNTSFGEAFYRYARTVKFLRDFSIRQLFAASEAVDDEWLNTLRAGAEDPASRHAVFSFLAGFWRQDYSQSIKSITQPTLVVIGDKISSVSKEGKQVTADKWLVDYLANLSHSRGIKISGRNVLPYESTAEFVAAIALLLPFGQIAPFVDEIT